MNLQKRQRMFVNGLIQGRLLMRAAGYWIVYHVVLWHTLFLYRYLEYRAALAAGAPPKSFSEQYGAFVLDYYPMVICAALVLPILLYDVMWLTHRIAGPLARFENTLKRMERGERVAPVRLRDRDLLMHFQGAFNDFIAHYNSVRYGSGPIGDRDPESIEQGPISERQLLATLCELRQATGVVAEVTESQESLESDTVVPTAESSPSPASQA